MVPGEPFANRRGSTLSESYSAEAPSLSASSSPRLHWSMRPSFPWASSGIVLRKPIWRSTLASSSGFSPCYMLRDNPASSWTGSLEKTSTHRSYQLHSSSPPRISSLELTGRRGCWDTRTVFEADYWAGFETFSQGGKVARHKDPRNKTQPRRILRKLTCPDLLKGIRVFGLRRYSR